MRVEVSICEALLVLDTRCRSLELIEAPLIDLEVRGVPALTYFGGLVWK